MDDELLNLAKEYLRREPTQKFKDEMEALVKAGDVAVLRKRLEGRLQFGTAGLRGPMGAGNACMNDLTVIQASQGLCSHLISQEPQLKTKGVVVGYDGRHNSKDFAEWTAAVFISKGVPVHLFRKLVPTPFVPFTVVRYKCAAGVMVTASHNPKEDNGYKVYWGNGPQIIPPVDSGIANAIAENLDPWATLDRAAVYSSALCLDPTEAIPPLYNESMCALKYNTGEWPNDIVPITYTAMHGVGYPWIGAAFKAFGLPPVIPTPAQVEADPEFPTVAFPNPEEGKGALKLAIEAAEANSSSLILANDPDADRLAVAERQEDGQWVILTGNQIGTLFAHWQWFNWRRKNPNADPSKVAMLNSTVSSKALRAIANKEGFLFEETLTGFKWMGNRTVELQAQGYEVLFAYEEAIGFMLGTSVVDKDGVSAACVFAEMANYLRHTHKRSVVAHLEHLFSTYGYFEHNNRYFFCYQPPVIDAIFARLRSSGDEYNGSNHMRQCGRFRVAKIRDLTTGYDDNQADNKAILPTSSSSHMITYSFENGAVVTLRTSGTEPKLKYYAEMGGASREAVRKELDELVGQVIAVFLEPEKNNLTAPSS